MKSQGRAANSLNFKCTGVHAQVRQYMFDSLPNSLYFKAKADEAADRLSQMMSKEEYNQWLDSLPAEVDSYTRKQWYELFKSNIETLEKVMGK